MSDIQYKCGKCGCCLFMVNTNFGNVVRVACQFDALRGTLTGKLAGGPCGRAATAGTLAEAFAKIAEKPK